MSQAFYRKWRPRLWEQVVGQEHVIQTLQNAIHAERVSHAYLFAGPRGTGKTTTARFGQSAQLPGGKACRTSLRQVPALSGAQRWPLS